MTLPVIRFRISTAFMALGLVGLPFAAFWVVGPNPFAEGTTAWRAFSWLLLDLPPLLFVIGFFVAFISTVVDAFKRRWQSIPQGLGEMIVCFTCFMLIPVY